MMNFFLRFVAVFICLLPQIIVAADAPKFERHGVETESVLIGPSKNMEYGLLAISCILAAITRMMDLF